MTTSVELTKPTWPVFPCHWVEGGKCSCGLPDCDSPGKHPLTEHGLTDATTDSATITRWRQRWPKANKAIRTGDGLLVIDIDIDKGGFDTLAELEEKHGRPPETVEVRTGSGGLHLYYRYPAGENIGSRNGWLPGIDCKATGGYVIAAGATHRDGKYRWEPGHSPSDIEIADAPGWLLELLPRKGEHPKHELNGHANGNSNASLIQRAQRYVAKADPADEGQRNDTAFQLAGHVAALRGEYGERLGESEILSLMDGWNLRNNPPLAGHELKQCVQSALRNGTPRQPKEPPKGMPDLRPAEYWEQPAPEVKYRRFTSAELDGSDFSVEFAIEGALVLGQPLTIGGPMKVLKTSILCDSAVSLADAGFFLGRFKVNRRYRTAVMSGESGMASLQEIARRICAAAGKELKNLTNLIWSPDIPKFGSLAHMDALEAFLRDNGIEVLFVDPAYLAMPSADAANLMAQGELLRNIADVCQRLGVTLVLCHHTKRNTGQDPYEPLELQHLAWAGHAEFARQWWLVNRRERYVPGTGEHRLWLSIGGSAGHSSLWALDINEGTLADVGGRRWEVQTSDAAGARDAAAERAREAKRQRDSERLEVDRKAICEAMAALPASVGTKTDIKDASGLNETRFAPAFASLIQDKIALKTKITKGNNQQYDAYKLNNE